MPTVRSVFRTSTLPQAGRQVLGTDLNRSESKGAAAPPVLLPNDGTQAVATPHPVFSRLLPELPPRIAITRSSTISGLSIAIR
jgi:hypothetical protein